MEALINCKGKFLRLREVKNIAKQFGMLNVKMDHF